LRFLEYVWKKVGTVPAKTLTATLRTLQEVFAE
jgi:hypothetical protein